MVYSLNFNLLYTFNILVIMTICTETKVIHKTLLYKQLQKRHVNCRLNKALQKAN
jgi:hypothetical protein